jgi:hypothetical protein
MSEIEMLRLLTALPRLRDIIETCQVRRVLATLTTSMVRSMS